MECPHCHEQISSEECHLCGQKVLTGSNFCSSCGHQLPAGEQAERKLLTCSSCDRKLLPEDNYCPGCGNPAHGHDRQEPQGEEAAAPAEGQRLACPDGACIGIIGEDGRCTECGKTQAEAAEAEA